MPASISDAPYGNRYCPWQLVASQGTREFYAGGVDSLQALLLAVSMARDILKHDVNWQGTLTWLTTENLGLELRADVPTD